VCILKLYSSLVSIYSFSPVKQVILGSQNRLFLARKTGYFRLAKQAVLGSQNRLFLTRKTGCFWPYRLSIVKMLLITLGSFRKVLLVPLY
jgi:hypothetical protein